jgi:uncharacterized damage-inducible protein DinB
MDVATAALFARYRAWADHLTYDSVAALPPGEATKPRETLFKTIIGTLNHNLLIDMVWQAHIEGRDHGFNARNVLLCAEFGDLWKAQQSMNQWWINWCAAQTDSSLEEPVPFRFIDGGDSVMTRGAILLHVVNHGSYHRGWIAEMFYDIRCRPPATDLPVFLHEVGA